jgi:hypothetical protein
VPEFIVGGSSPPSVFRTYLSLDALDFSYRTLKGDYPNHRIFDRDLQSHIIARRRPYKPPAHLAAQANPPEFHPERAELYIELRHLFPEAQAWAFVAPTAAWTVAQLALDGRLDAYLGALERASTAFDRFIDLSIPSEITVSTTNTFDGLHYVDAVNRHTLTAMISGQPAPGVDWRQQPQAEIAAQYRDRIERLVMHPQPSASN